MCTCRAGIRNFKKKGKKLMGLPSLQELPGVARANLVALLGNNYPGRGIGMGIDPTGTHILQFCWTMGRSESSRNRRYKKDGGRLYTEYANPDGPKGNDELVIYDAMAENTEERLYAVSNGRQTSDCLKPLSLRQALVDWSYEPDKPTNTSRISGRVHAVQKDLTFEFATHRRSPDSETCLIETQHIPACEAGFGYYISTYERDGTPLPQFEGEARPIPMSANLCHDLFHGLNQDNIVSVAVKWIPLNRDGTSISINVANKY